MPILYGSNTKKKATAAPSTSLKNPYTLEELSKDINSGAVKTQEQLDTKLQKRGYSGNTEQNRVTVSSSAYLPGKAPTAVATTKTSRYSGTGINGQSKGTNSAGARYGSAGRGMTETSIYGADSAGNNIVGSLGGRNVITGGQGSTVDRTAGIRGNNPMDSYMAMFSPESVINRQKRIRDELARERQQQIDAIELSTRSAVQAEQASGAEDLARQRSMNLRAGLGGSDFGAANKAEVRNRTNENVRKIQAEGDMAVGQVIDSIDQLANQRFQLEQGAMQQNFSNSMEYEQYVQGQMQQQRAQAVESIAQLGKSGLDIATIKERDPQLYDNLLTASGMGEVELEAVLNNNKPAPAKIDYQYKVAGGKIIAFGIDPTTGQLKMVEQDAGLPDNYKTLTADDGTILGIPENWDGDTSKIVTVGNYRKPFASEMGGGVPAGDVTVNMTTQQRAAFNSIVDKFNKSPLVAAADRTIVLKNSIDNVRNDPSNGTLQLNLVYSYIQALDTYQSAVREGELSLVNSIDSKVGQLGQYVQSIQNGQIVRPEVANQIADAADKIVNTIQEGAKRKQQQFRSQASVNGIGNQWDAYIGGYQVDTQDNGIRSQVDAAGYNYDAMKADGLSDEEILASLNPQPKQTSLDSTVRTMFPASSLLMR